MEDSVNVGRSAKPDYGVDAPNVLRNLFLFGVLCLVLGFVGPRHIHVGPIDFLPRSMFRWTSLFLLLQALLYVLYVRVGKFRHRDLILGMHVWRGDERVLDVGCGRGLLLAGAAKRMAELRGTGRATGIDIWSNVDMGGNAESATRANLEMEGVSERCDLVSAPAQEMPFPDASFDVVVSNLCLHNIYDTPTRRAAVAQIARVLKPGGVALLSDYKLTGEYAEQLRDAGMTVRRKMGGPLAMFPPLRVMVARKPLA